MYATAGHSGRAKYQLCSLAVGLPASNNFFNNSLGWRRRAPQFPKTSSWQFTAGHFHWAPVKLSAKKLIIRGDQGSFNFCNAGNYWTVGRLVLTISVSPLLYVWLVWKDKWCQNAPKPKHLLIKTRKNTKSFNLEYTNMLVVAINPIL